MSPEVDPQVARKKERRGADGQRDNSRRERDPLTQLGGSQSYQQFPPQKYYRCNRQ